MTNLELKDKIDLDITNKTATNSITPINVGEDMKLIVDYAEEQVVTLTNTVTTNDGNVIHTSGNETKTGTLTTTGFIKSGGTGSQYLMANGSVSTGPLDYKIYTAVLNQATSDPVATVIGTNTIGNVVWTKSIDGVYFATLTGAFTANKSFHFVSKQEGTGVSYTVKGVRNSNDVYQIATYNSSNTLADSILNGTLIELRVYN